MIRDITISATGTGDDQYYEPPARVLSLAVTGGDAYLAIYEHGNAERTAGGLGRPEFSGQQNWCYFMPRAAGSGTRRGPLAES